LLLVADDHLPATHVPHLVLARRGPPEGPSSIM
jgi:hypothetical protein